MDSSYHGMMPHEFYSEEIVQVRTLVRKVYGFWDCEGMILIDTLHPGHTVISEVYFQNLKKKKRKNERKKTISSYSSLQTCQQHPPST